MGDGKGLTQGLKAWLERHDVPIEGWQLRVLERLRFDGRDPPEQAYSRVYEAIASNDAAQQNERN